MVDEVTLRKNDNYVLFGFVLGVCAAAILFALFECYLFEPTHAKQMRTIRAEAVRRGHAEFVLIDGKDEPEWRWKEPKPEEKPK